MNVTLWGTRGSIASAAPDMLRYGGETSCVEIGADERSLIIDAGSGIRPLGEQMAGRGRIDILLSHLHMDHVQGLPFFGPLLDPTTEVHVWGPISTTKGLRARLSRYLSPPLFPIHVRDLANVEFHDLYPGVFEIGGFTVKTDLVAHPGSTLGYRVEDNGRALTYISDHEPALGGAPSPDGWTSGFELSANSDLLIHDSQYSDEEYADRVGWGHTSTSYLAAFVKATSNGRLVTFHHDPSHTDDLLDDQVEELAEMLPGVDVLGGTSGLTLGV